MTDAGGEAVVADRPRRASQVVFSAFRLYRRYPLLFLVLPLGVVVPFRVIQGSSSSPATPPIADGGPALGRQSASKLMSASSPSSSSWPTAGSSTTGGASRSEAVRARHRAAHS